MESRQPRKMISKRGLKVWRISGGILSLLFWVVLIVGTAIAYFSNWFAWIWLGLIGGVLVFFLTLLITWIIPGIRWRRWRYEVREQEIELQHGVFVITRTLVPMVRVQHVDTVQGPILRKYKLATIQISTAATQHEIPAVDLEEAEELRHAISRLARVAEEDV